MCVCISSHFFLIREVGPNDFPPWDAMVFVVVDVVVVVVVEIAQTGAKK